MKLFFSWEINCKTLLMQVLQRHSLLLNISKHLPDSVLCELSFGTASTDENSLELMETAKIVATWQIGLVCATSWLLQSLL